MMLVKHAVLCVAAVAVALSGATPAEGQASVSFLGDAVLAADSLDDASHALDLAPAPFRAREPALALAAGGFPFRLVAQENGGGLDAGIIASAPDVETAATDEAGGMPLAAETAKAVEADDPAVTPETDDAAVMPAGDDAAMTPELAASVTAEATAARTPARRRSGPLGAEMPEGEPASTTTDAPATGLVRAEAAAGLRFRASQLREPRVALARRHAEANVRAMFTERGLRYPTELFFRVFKQERVFELWALDPAEDRYVLVREYPVCAVSGHLGPKRQAGDRQVPEGFYDIDLLNPRSKYHLSMRVNYPNAVDLELSRADRPGGDIYVHGGCSTVGCVPVTDEAIEELYWLAVEARAQGQKTIPIHIFPTRMDGPAMRELAELSRGDYSTWRLWLSLKAGYDHFETHRQLPEIGHREGYYSVGR